jgi:hypothetical protein
VGRSPHRDQRGVLADPVRAAVARRAAELRPLETVYNRHRRWSADGTWEEMLDEFRRDADLAEGVDWSVGVDAGVVRAHQLTAGARYQPPADVPAEVVAPVDVDTGGRVESQEVGGSVEGEAQPGSAGPLPRRVDVQDSPRR